MKRKQFFALSVAALIGVSGVNALSAGASPTSIHSKGAHAVVTGPVVIDKDDPRVAWVSGNYTCPPGEDAHLFVSAKQVADGKPDRRLKEEGSSAISAGWLERHPGPDEFTCDGTMHHGTWKIDSFSEYGHGELIPGQTYVQFCWTGPEIGEEEFEWFAFFEQFVNAR
jgi:hypothetical protein